MTLPYSIPVLIKYEIWNLGILIIKASPAFSYSLWAVQPTLYTDQLEVNKKKRVLKKENYGLKYRFSSSNGPKIHIIDIIDIKEIHNRYKGKHNDCKIVSSATTRKSRSKIIKLYKRNHK